MKTTVLFALICIVLNLGAIGQSVENATSPCNECPPAAEILAKQAAEAANPDLSTSQGLSDENGKLSMSPLAQKLLVDSTYRLSLYPATYSFDAIPQLLEEGKTLLALWYMINLYPVNPKLCLDIHRELKKSGLTPNLYINSYYTFVFFDPELVVFENAKPVLANPERMEQKMAWCKALATQF